MDIMYRDFIGKTKNKILTETDGLLSSRYI